MRALLALLLLAAAAAAAEQCTIRSLHNLVAEGRRQDLFVSEAYSAYSSLMTNFRIIEARLSGTCEGLEDRRSKLQKFTQYIQPATYIPPLKALITPVKNLGERLDVAVLKKPTESVCKLVGGIRAQIDKTNTTLVTAQKVADAFFKVTVSGYNAAGTALDALELAGVPENAQCSALSLLCKATSELVKLEKAMADKAALVTKELDAVGKALNTIENKVKAPINILETIFKGPVDSIIGGVEKLLKTEVTLPLPRGSKNRGVGEIPTCCPSGWSRSAGLCYENCRSGYATVLLACVERCPSGWKDIGVACSRVVWVKKKKKGIKIKLPKTEVRKKNSYARLGRAPATFGNDACACRSSKKYLEAGLCYNKCGRDAFVNYPTKVLTTCVDLRPTKLSILDLTKHLDIFDKAKDIPGLGQALTVIENIIKKAFANMSSFITKAAGVTPPTISVSSLLPGVNSLVSLDNLADLDLAERFGRAVAGIPKNPDCRN